MHTELLLVGKGLVEGFTLKSIKMRKTSKQKIKQMETFTESSFISINSKIFTAINFCSLLLTIRLLLTIKTCIMAFAIQKSNLNL